METKKTSVRFRPDIYEMLESLAKADHRSKGKQLEFLIMEAYAKRNGRSIDEQGEG